MNELIGKTATVPYEKFIPNYDGLNSKDCRGTYTGTITNVTVSKAGTTFLHVTPKYADMVWVTMDWVRLDKAQLE